MYGSTDIGTRWETGTDGTTATGHGPRTAAHAGSGRDTKGSLSLKDTGKATGAVSTTITAGTATGVSAMATAIGMTATAGTITTAVSVWLQPVWGGFSGRPAQSRYHELQNFPHRADVAKLADAPDLGSGFQKKWRFKSSHPHHAENTVA
jgi:hypothetical protein